MDGKNKKGFTLVELLIVMTIMIILAIIAVGAINPIAQVDKGSDAKRKKDLGRIKIAMEDYYNDKGCYPVQTKIDLLSCGSGDFAPWLASWPCDNRNEPYKLVVGPSLCPKWFKVFTKLDNKKDTGIPEGWATEVKFVGSPAKVYPNSEVNYGMSSTNVKWDERAMPDYCGTTECMVDGGGGTCNGSNCSGSNCYVGNCNPECHVRACDEDGIVVE